MRHLLSILTMAMTCMALAGCQKKETSNAHDINKPADLSSIIDAHKWYLSSHDEDKMTKIIDKISPDLPEHEFYLTHDTSFVLRVPEYAHASHPALAHAEDIYNGMCLGWDVYSNVEIWKRSQVSDILRTDEEVAKAIQDISTDIFQNNGQRKAAEDYKSAVFKAIHTPAEKWTEETDPMAALYAYCVKTNEMAYSYCENVDSFYMALDSVKQETRNRTMTVFQEYLEADEEHQLGVILRLLASCKSFDDQCSLWYNWADCTKSEAEDEWIVAVGDRLMRSGSYCILLGDMWMAWRALCQCSHFGLSRDSAIPNHFYNEFRKMCYTACLRRISEQPDDVLAIHNAYSIAFTINLIRCGSFIMGNEALIECAKALPKRYAHFFSNETDVARNDGE